METPSPKQTSPVKPEDKSRAVAPKPATTADIPTPRFEEGAIYRDTVTGVKKRYFCGLFMDA